MTDEQEAPRVVAAEERKHAAQAPSIHNADPDLFEKVFARIAPAGHDAFKAGAGDLIKRRRISFTVDGASCSPDVFVDAEGEYYDFTLTIQSLNHKEELEALAGVTDPSQVQTAMARLSLYAVNGKPLPKDVDKQTLFWEALGPQGRQLVILAFSQVGSAGAAALGKYQRSYTVG